VWWGGFVTATGSGMAFREWLTPDGSFLPLYPWLSSAGDKFIEHGHRLLAMAVGFFTILLVVIVHCTDPRRGVRYFSLALLAGVLLQGLLGGLRVVLDERLLALLHGCIGPLFFAATAAMVVVTSPKWIGVEPSSLAKSDGPDASYLRLAVLTAALAWLQLVLGAIVRHSPHLLSESAATIFRVAVYAHLIAALLVVIQVLRLAAESWGRRAGQRLAFSMALLVFVQLLLGASTWLLKYGVPQWASGALGQWQFVNTEADLYRAAIITAHGAVGALLVALSVAAAVDAAGAAGLRWRQARGVAAKGVVA
jgi:cytochrome c oxidase assembly protein subunit 15